MITTGPIEGFFKPPTEPPSDHGGGILFHLRCDLVKLYGREGDFKGDVSAQPMLAMMGMLAGIDYLSKVYSSQGTSRRRFVETVRDLCALNINNAEALYQFRCALIHSVSLSAVSTCAYERGTKFVFEITDQADTPVITKLSDDRKEATYRINFWELKRCFSNVIDSLFAICMDSSDSRNPHVVNMVGQLHSEKIVQK